MGGSGRLLALAASAALVVALAPTAWAAPPGPAYSWGTNDQGRLGTGGNTYADFNLPVPMAAPSQFTSLAAGSTHGCGLDAEGAAWCWGDDTYGQLGNGTAPGDDSVPVAVNGGRSYNLISAGADSSCATPDDDTIYCWGRNTSGQLGNGTLTDSSIPVPVSETRASLTDIDSISAGGSSACAVANAADNVYCWGSNTFGQLGNGTTADDSMPRPVADFVNRTRDDGLGSNIALGVYSLDDTIFAATIGGVSRSTDGGKTFTNQAALSSAYVNGVYANDDTVYAATSDGLSISPDGGVTFPLIVRTPDGLGSNSVNGVYAIGSTVYAATGGGLSISTNGGRSFTTRTIADGLGSNNVRAVYAIGSNVYAATADGLSISANGGTSFTNYTFMNGLGSDNVRAVYAIGSTVYAATGFGLGISTNGGTSFTNYTSSNGLGSNNVRAVYAIGSTVYAATDGGLAVSTDGGTSFTNYTSSNGLGDNMVYGVYAVGPTVYAATNAGLSISLPDYAFADVSVGVDFACAVTRASGPTGPGVCWGANFAGELGRGSSGAVMDSAVPQPLARPAGATSDLVVKSIATGRNHACAISLDDSVYCWGGNSAGQLGLDDTAPRATPTRVAIPGSAPVRDVSAGEINSCAITDDTTYCWGYGGSGALGNGSNSDSTTPTAVTLTGIDAQNSPVQVVSGTDYNAFIVKPRMSFLDGTAFASVQVGQSTSTAVTVRNVRLGSMTITGTSVTGQGVSIAPGGTCSGILLPTDDCTVNLSWTPTTGGALSGASLTISYIGNSSTTPLAGTATDVTSPPSISPSAQTLTGMIGTAVTPTARFTAENFSSAPAYSIYPSLPAGLTLDRATGVVSGTSTVTYPSTRHWITASTPGGSQTASSTLQVSVNAAPPSPPRGVDVTGGDASIAVTWQASQSDGGSAITGYTATATPGGATCSTVSLTCTITGLTNGTTYTVAVTATNAAGASSPASAGPVTPGKPVITITGSRDGQRITVTGTAMHLDSQTVRPWIRFPGETSFSQGAAVIPVAADGTFTWSRRSGKKIYVYIAHGTVKSNTVNVSAR